MYLGVTDERTTERKRRICAHVKGRSMLNTVDSPVINALSVDVEDYFHVGAFEHVIDIKHWDSYPFRVGDNTRRVLDLFDECEVKGTFFILGWVAERDPELIRQIADRGHEIACHGYGHQLVFKIGPEAFYQDIARSKGLLEDHSGREVCGYRAPSYSVTRESLWALDILIENGFTFDSSIFPIYHDVYGIPNSPRFPYEIEREAGRITEFPITTYPCKVFGKQFDLPFSGGGYFRLLPFPLVDRAMTCVNAGEKQPAVFYFHPWEIDPDQPRIRGAGWKSSFRHYVNLGRTWNKLKALLTSYSFGTVSEVLGRGMTGIEPTNLEEM